MSYPLLTESQVLGTYLGAFRIPTADTNGYSWAYCSIGGMDFDPADGQLYILNGYGVAKISIPALVSSSNPLLLNEATVTQGAIDPGEGQITGDLGTGDWKLGNVIVYGSRIYCNVYWYFDAGGAQVKTHFRHNKVLATSGDYAGLVELDVSPATEAGWVSTVMGRCPTGWQSLLGGPMLTGGGSIPIITRQPFGHSIYSFDPDDVNVAGEPIPATMILGHDDAHSIGGYAWGSQNDVWNGTSLWNGITLLDETRNVLICGMHGTGPWYYGNGNGTDPGGYTDPEFPAHGTHAYPYRYQIWVYDAEELAAVKAGTMQPWEPQPVAIWTPTFPTASGAHQIIGQAYDADNGILYLMQGRVHGFDNSFPVVHAYQVDGSGGTPPDPPDPGEDPGDSVSRYYVTAKAPAAIIHGPFQGEWAGHGIFNETWCPLYWQWELSSSKTDAGETDRNQILYCNQSGKSTAFLSLWTPPLFEQTISGTLDYCWHHYQSWRDLVGGGIHDSSDVWVKIHAYITVGDSTDVRHVLIDNWVNPDEIPYTGALSASSPASPIAMTSGDCETGDRVRIELGFYAVMATPDPTQVPTEYTQIEWLLPGATGVDLTPGMSDGFFTQRSPWIEFSPALVQREAPDPPANDSCSDAIEIPSIPYHSAAIDCSQSAGTARETWWTWTSTVTGEVLAHVFGSNFYAILDVKTDEGDPDEVCPGIAISSFEINYADSIAQHRGTSSAIFMATAGWRYWFRVYNKTTSPYNVANGGGMVRFGLVERATAPVQDDLYLPQGNVIQTRDGQIVNLTPTFNGHSPSAVAIDYTGDPMDDLNGGTHTGERLLVGLFVDGLIEVIDLPSLAYDEVLAGEIDYIELDPPTDPDYNRHISTMHITAAGLLYAATFGTGFEYVTGIGEPGSPVSYLSTVSDDPVNSDVVRMPAASGANQGGGPPTQVHLAVSAILTSPWAIAIDEVNGILYYVEGSFYIPVGGQTIKRYDLNADAPLSDFATLSVPAAATNCPGVKGLTYIPYDGSLLVCNATELVHLDSGGNVVATFTPSVAMDSQALCDVKMQADGETCWVVDMPTGRLYKVDVATMTELATYETWQVPTSLTQMAIYQPGGITEPEEPPIPPPEEVPSPEDCPVLQDLVEAPESPLARLMRVHNSATHAVESLAAPAEEGYGGVLGDDSFGEFVLAGDGLEDSDSDNCLTIASAPAKTLVGRLKVVH